MKELIAFMLQFGDLNKQELDLIISKAVEKELRKDECLIEPGEVFDQVVFVLDGILRIYYYNDRGEEITKYFVDENHLFRNPYMEEPLDEYIQALTDCKLIIFSRQDWAGLSGSIDGWTAIAGEIFQRALVEKLDRRSSLVPEDATTRYLSFLDKFPTLVNRVPLSHVASYLGMTQQSLSRIRKNIRLDHYLPNGKRFYFLLKQF